MSERPPTIAAVDDALRECSKRLRLAREQYNYEAVVVYTAQANRLLGWRKELSDAELLAAAR